MMRRIVVVGLFALAWALLVIVAAATVKRTFVASHGLDTYPCTISQPCRTFTTALAKTSDNGEVIVLDSSGYGTVTITQSVSIIAPAGVYAGISVVSGNGIEINGSAIVVVLRGLTINGQGGYYGVSFSQGKELTIEECEIANMQGEGVALAANDSNVTVKNTTIRNNGGGVLAFSTSGIKRVSISNSVIANNNNGVSSTGTSGGATALIVTRSTLVGNTFYGFYVYAEPGASASAVSDGNIVTYSDVGFYFGPGGGDERIYTVGNNTAGYVNTPVYGGVLTSCCGI